MDFSVHILIWPIHFAPLPSNVEILSFLITHSFIVAIQLLFTIVFLQILSKQKESRPPFSLNSQNLTKNPSTQKMNLVLDAFERVLYPTGATAERRRRASTGYFGQGTIQRASGRQNGGDYSPKQQKFSATSSSASAFSPHHQSTQNSSFSPPISRFPASLAIRREKAAAVNRRRRSVTPNRGNVPSAGNKTIWNESNFNDGQQQICHSNSLTGISGHNQLEVDQIENSESTNQTLEMAMASSQYGGITSTIRNRSSATSGGIGRRKKSMNVGRKQSVASLLFTALASPTIDPNKLRRRQSRAAAFASANNHRRNSPPPRQWSVPEKSNLVGEEGDEEQEEEEEEHFRLIQKARSISMSTPAGGRSPVRQLSSEDPTIIGPAVSMPINSPQPQCCSSSMSIGSPILPNSPFACCPSCSSTNSGSSSVLLGFFPPPPPLPAGSFRPLNGRRASETACLTDWIRLRAEAANSLSEALLLRCVDPEPAFPFLQLANFADHEQTIRLAEELAQNGHAQFGCFDELFALERAKSSSSPMAGKRSGFHGSQGTIVDEDTQQQHYLSQQQMQGSSSGCMSPSTDGQSFGTKNSLCHRQQQHRGFILVCFRLLDEEGEGSPPFGSTLAKSAELESSWLSWTGAAQIYKYSPRAWCLRRLSLLRRVHPGFPTSAPFAYVLLCEFDAILHPTNALAALDMCERLRARNCGLVALYQVRQCFASSNSSCSSINPPQHHSSAQSLASNSLSPHWSPHQLRRQQLARMGRSQDERGRQGGGALLRMIHGRDGSLGWDVVQPTITNQSPIQTQPTTIQPPPQIGPKHWRGEPNIGTSL